MLIPSLALTALWGTYTVAGFNEALDLRQTVRDVEAVGVNGVTAMVALQEERRLSMIYLSQPEADREALEQQRADTDQKLAAMSVAAEPVVENNPPALQEIFGRISQGFAMLPDFRQQVDARAVNHAEAYEFYTGAVSTGMTYFEAEARLTNDSEALNEGTTAADLFRALESLARQNAVLSAGLSSPDGMSAAEQRQLTGLVGVQREQWGVVAPALRGAQAENYQAITAGPEWSTLVDAEDSAVLSGRISPAFEEWQASMLQVAASMQQLTLNQVDFAVGFANDRVDDLMTSVILTSVGALLAIALAVLISVLVSRALIRRLRELRRATLRLAEERLPAIIGRLQQGDKVELAEAVPEIEQGSDEIGQVAGAFATAQRIAVRAAIEQAETREGISRVFLNLAQRSQGLVHRQLALLDTLERGNEEDPDLLAELFRVDHLATRMRRNSENLSILGGAMPARRWRRPVRLTEILRAAAAQTEDYSRVKLAGIPEVTLAGPVAGDMMHLLSELVENATTFAPPHTSVLIRAEVVPKGLGIEIEDRGIGMAEEVREQANRLLAAAPEFNVMGFTEDTRLGLFVVARLAARHNISITLRPSPYGGTSAIVLAPTDLLEEVEPDAQHPDRAEAMVGTAAPVAGGTRPSTGSPAWTRDAGQPATPPSWETTRPRAEAVATLPRREEPRLPDNVAPLRDDPPEPVSQEPRKRAPKQLPRRVRQASMQPQLLHPATPAPEAAPRERSAEEARRLMSTYQRQSYRGRADAEREPDGRQDDVAGDWPTREGQWDPR
ncbi:HAMP domain-containing protein [Streptomyces sp. 8K308]|uniref:nitrate- and nitrite sensing domain-containing protein n=1 Tax=Streptomyces sp. 8K308 TaxID=2530388 RepID=UPI001051F7F0|nr:nitrate- and nitrite sensing domain-containing protein [Streptomyces sp. 8K308]TDC20501.1 HAMP domain-containing protein [Streptomyces sp. 8K308]